MGRIADEIIREVRDRVDIVDLIGRHLTLKKSGRSFVGLCPFHDEKTPSFSVSSEKQSFYCFGCHQGGTVYTFLMHVENLTFPEAVRTLARECGIEIPETSGGDTRQTDDVYRANEIAQEQYRKGIAVPGNPALAYLDARGLDAGAIDAFEIGYVPDSWDTVTSALRGAGIDGAVGARAGLLAERQSGGHYDRLRGRVTFPIRDVRGRIVGFGGRALGPDQEPKYLNTPESPVFRKREAFYGYPDALAPMRTAGRVVVVEGYFDRIALARAGVGGSVATCGTALTPEHVRDLKRRTREVVLLFDGDEAGQRALEKALEILLPVGMRVRACPLPAGDDPDSFLAREGADALRAQVDASPPAFDSVIARAAARGHATPWEKADAVADVAKLLALIGDPVERGEFSSQLALAVGTEARHVEAAVIACRRGEDARDAAPVGPRKLGPEDRIAGQLLRSLIEFPALCANLPDDVLALMPEGPPAQAAALLIVDPTPGRPRDVEALCQDLDAETARLLRQLAADASDLDEPTAARVVDDTLIWLRKRQRREESRRITARVKSAGDDWRTALEEKQRHARREDQHPQ